MLLKTGDLAKRCGLTTRALHHYETIGLLTPSARSESGYRLYNRNDIARLHQIQALKRFGLSLSDIGAVLKNPDARLVNIVETQIRMLNQQISRSTALRDRLTRLQDMLEKGEKPDLAEWLVTLEMMTMYDKYFTKDEQRNFPLLRTAEHSTSSEWTGLVKSVTDAMERKIPAQSAQAQALATRWMSMLMRDSGGDPRLLAKLNEMHFNEPAVQEQTGITLAMIAYILQAFAETKYAIYQNYLSPDELGHLRKNYLESTGKFPALISRMRQHMEDGTPACDPELRQLVLRWLELFRAFAGEDPATHEKIREAGLREPELYEGTGIDPALLGYVRSAISHLMQSA